MTNPEQISEAVRAAIGRLLGNGEALTYDDLVNAVIAEVDPGSPDEVEHEVDAVIIDDNSYLVAPDDRVVDLRALLDGRVFSHRMTAAEVDRGVAAIDPDIILPLLTFRDDVVRFAGGGVGSLHAFEPESLDDAPQLAVEGPPGWLHDATGDEIVGFTLSEGEMTAVRNVDAADSDAISKGLLAAFERVMDSELASAPLVDVVVDCILADPTAFAAPVAPLGELLEAAGLERRAGWLGKEGSEWMSEDEAAAAERRAFRERAYGFNECCHDAFDVVMTLLSLQDIDEEIPAPIARVGVHELAHGAVADAFVREVELLSDDADEAADALFALTGQLEKHARGADSAAVRYVEGMAHDLAGDLPAAERALQAALAADPGHQSSLEEASWYSHIRGDWARAAEYLRRSGDDDSAALDEMLDCAAQSNAATPKAGRNDPCPCGSGKKHKSCCLGLDRTPLETRSMWFYGKALHYAHRPGPRSVILGMATHVASAITGGNPDSVAVLEVVRNPFLADVALFEEQVLRDFLDDAGPLLPPDEVEMAEGWLGRSRALYEVMEERDLPADEDDVVMVLRNTRTGETVDVTWGGQRFEIGQFVLARVGRAGSQWRAVGPVSEVPLMERDALIELTSRPADAAEWLDWMASTLRPPELRTMDGERFMFCEGHYRVKNRKVALAALADAFEAGDTPDEFFELIDGDDGRSLHGSLVLTGRELTVWTTSEERFEKLTEKVAALIPNAVLVAEERLTPAEFQARRIQDDLEEDHVVGAEMDKELREVLVAKMRVSAERWVEMQIPALGDLTPRQALDDPTRRQDLILLLKEFEARPTAAGADLAERMPIDYIRELLGLPKPS